MESHENSEGLDLHQTRDGKTVDRLIASHDENVAQDNPKNLAITCQDNVKELSTVGGEKVSGPQSSDGSVLVQVEEGSGFDVDPKNYCETKNANGERNTTDEITGTSGEITESGVANTKCCDTVIENVNELSKSVTEMMNSTCAGKTNRSHVSPNPVAVESSSDVKYPAGIDNISTMTNSNSNELTTDVSEATNNICEIAETPDEQLESSDVVSKVKIKRNNMPQLEKDINEAQNIGECKAGGSSVVSERSTDVDQCNSVQSGVEKINTSSNKASDPEGCFMKSSDKVKVSDKNLSDIEHADTSEMHKVKSKATSLDMERVEEHSNDFDCKIQKERQRINNFQKQQNDEKGFTRKDDEEHDPAGKGKHKVMHKSKHSSSAKRHKLQSLKDVHKGEKDHSKNSVKRRNYTQKDNKSSYNDTRKYTSRSKFSGDYDETEKYSGDYREFYPEEIYSMTEEEDSSYHGESERNNDEENEGRPTDLCAVLSRNAVNPEVAKKFAEACVSFLKTSLNKKPSSSHEINSLMSQDDRCSQDSDRDGRSQYRWKRKWSNHQSSFNSDSDSTENEFTRYRSPKKRHERLSREKASSTSWGDTKHFCDESYSPNVSYSSDERCRERNSRRSSYNQDVANSEVDQSERHKSTNPESRPQRHRRERLSREESRGDTRIHDHSYNPNVSYSSDERSHPQRSRRQSLKREKSTETCSTSWGNTQHFRGPNVSYSLDERYRKRSSRQSSYNRHEACHKSHPQRHRHASKETRKHTRRDFDPIGIYRNTLDKVKQQCKMESDPVIRRALLTLLDVHKRECSLYLEKPDAHPDYSKEYKVFLCRKRQNIIELTGDPDTFDFYGEWRKYWPPRMNTLLEESWEEKKKKCINIISQKNSQPSSGSSADSPSSSSSSSSSDDNTDSDKNRRSQRRVKKKKSHNSRHKNVSANEQDKQKTEYWKPAENYDEEVGDLNLELNIQRYRRNKDPGERSKEVSSFCTGELQDQSLMSVGSQDQIVQETGAVQIVDILKVFNYMKERFGDLEEPLVTLYQKAVILKEQQLDSNQVLEEEENYIFFEKLGEKLNFFLENESLTAVQKVILQELHDRFSHILLQIKERRSPFMGLDMCNITRLIIGKGVNESIGIIKKSLGNQGYSNVSHEKLLSIYVHAKNELRKGDDPILSASKSLSQNSELSAPAVSCAGSSRVYQSHTEQQNPLSSGFPQKFSPGVSQAIYSSNVSLVAESPVFHENNIPHSQEAASSQNIASQLPSSPCLSGKKSSAASTDSVAEVEPSSVTVKERLPVNDIQLTASKHISSSDSSLVTPSSRRMAMSKENTEDFASSTGQASTEGSACGNSEFITYNSESSYQVSGPKLSQSLIKDCLSLPSSPSKDSKPTSSEDRMILDYKSPEYLFPTTLSGSLSLDLAQSSENIVDIHGKNFYETASSSNLFDASSSKDSSNVVKNTGNLQVEEPTTSLPKKPIRITIPLLSKQKSFIFSINPINDDEEF
ncbi:uncharacterized protein LOC121876070 [Homarus americanus]|uniref:Putative splicing factor 3A subunit 2-like 3 n=1 Tax=Homarus americanus TaxID=6706 RepID=A0A8J5MQW7_HOMAM|nr:uncharacterized protein LOC121876070 [Homarus americanus]XP_042236911.1 uncharacterized protein LOC121876070 [Homarus americanus]KAG7160520.1 putative splicing factor 3A subunit 2-like 3 [Homarus americanus]